MRTAEKKNNVAAPTSVVCKLRKMECTTNLGALVIPQLYGSSLLEYIPGLFLTEAASSFAEQIEPDRKWNSIENPTIFCPYSEMLPVFEAMWRTEHNQATLVIYVFIYIYWMLFQSSCMKRVGGDSSAAIVSSKLLFSYFPGFCYQFIITKALWNIVVLF